MKTITDYWFFLEPYVYVGLTNQYALLYNTLDGVTIESDKTEIIDLLKETLEKKQCGVSLLPNNRYLNENINAFISEIREKYMGDIIDVKLSDGKPVQVLPFFNLRVPDKISIYKKQNFSAETNLLKHLCEINLHIDSTMNVNKVLLFLESLPDNLSFTIIGNIDDVPNYTELFIYFEQQPSPKHILCSYKNIIALQPAFKNNFSYKVLVDFPIDMCQWNHSREILFSQTLPFEYIFEITSDDDYQQAEQLIECFELEKNYLKPVYTGNNMRFFEENVFLTKEDILAGHLTYKDFFSRQGMNMHDFGKINIMPNGDVHANINHPVLGNIYKDSINEIIYQEIEKGVSWFRIRNEEPCINCIYQWFCPSPSDYELSIGRPDLCHISN